VLNEADIFSYRVLLLDTRGKELQPASSYPGPRGGCVTTHDLRPLAGWWEDRYSGARALVCFRPGRMPKKERDVERVALTEALVGEGCLVPPGDRRSADRRGEAGAYKFNRRQPE